MELNQGLATLAFFGVGVNLVLFLTRVLEQDNAAAANSVSKWTGTVYIFSLIGAFLSDSYWGRYKTCAIFQVIFVLGLALLSLASQILLNPRGCGNRTTKCEPHWRWETGLFYLSIYMVALGNGGYQPNIVTFGADQFDEEDPKENISRVAFFSYFYLALNLGSLFSNTILSYFEDEGMWALGFWVSTGSAFLALILFLAGTLRYRYFKPSGNPFSRFCQVIVAATRKWRLHTPQGENNLYETDKMEGPIAGARKILHTNKFKILDKAALVTPRDSNKLDDQHNPWWLCSVTQVEEVKCIFRLLPIWLCTIIYSVVFTQMASLFVEQGAAMNCTITNFQIPPSSMSSFDILTVVIFTLAYHRVVNPVVNRMKKTNSKGLTELQRMGIGLVIAIMAMVAAGIVELYRLRYAQKDCIDCEESSSLSVFWQVPQYALIGISEVFMYIGQLEFFNQQTPDGLKTFGSALCMTSISLGNYVSSLLVNWFFFLLATLTTIDLVVYIACARWYKSIKFESRIVGKEVSLPNV
ncbi:hypothetical protein NMG60_11030145 [Bertholletia excelsa]